VGSEKNMKYLKFYETGRSGSGLDAGCLREIADFCEQETDSHKRGDESDG